MQTGKINVTADNIFPIIKKFLYSDHEIFLRELVSNAVDATTKLKTLTSIGEANVELGDLTIDISIDSENKTLTIKDRGIGMSADEVEKYINQVAFSGAEEFLKKYEAAGEKGIIGHFGLGFYSAFMVAKKVEIFSKSFRESEEAVHWTCEGNPEYNMQPTDKADRGTEIVLHLADDSEEFLDEARIQSLLDKYCKFLPVPIRFGTKTERENVAAEGEEPKYEEKTVDNIINNPKPAWTVAPSELKDEDYEKFYRELYPNSFEKPLFHIHLNVDYPFDLTGILFFPRLKPGMELQRNKIQLYQRQVFVTDNVEGIVPDFLALLHGVIDSRDIPLNVSRSYLQSDHNVKKIAGHISKKVSDKLEELFKKDREDFAKKWDDIKVIIEYGMLSDNKFFERAQKFALYKNTKGENFTWEEYLEKIKPLQIDKDGNVVILYTNHAEGQHQYVSRANDKGYDVLLLDSPIVSHLIQKMEMENQDKKVVFSRVDADTLDSLIKKEENEVSLLSDEEKTKVKESLEATVDKARYSVKVENLSSDEMPITVTVSEFFRRMQEMSRTSGGGFGADMPETYNLVVNANHPLIKKIADTPEDEKRSGLVKQAVDLALLQQFLLRGENLTSFIKRSYEQLADS